MQSELKSAKEDIVDAENPSLMPVILSLSSHS